MASGAERPGTETAVAAVAAGAASAVLFHLGTGLQPVWWITWLAPLPLLLLAPRVSARTTAAVAAVAYLAGMSGYAGYALSVLGVPVPLVAGICIVAAAVFTAVALLFRALLLRGRPVLAVLGAGATWAAAEYLVATFTPSGSNWTIANSQADNLPVLQIVSLTGPWGVGFVVLAVAAGFAALAAPSTRRARVSASVVGALVLTAALGYGAAQLASAPTQTIRVSAVAGPSLRDQPPAGSRDGEALIAAELDWVRTQANPGQVVVFPEKDLHVDDATLPGVVDRFSAAARARDVVIVLGVEQRSGGRLFNTALTFPRDGSPPLAYHKRYPIPGVEDAVTPGETPAFVPGLDVEVGVAICADLGQVTIGREYGRAGIAMMAVPALDFTADAWAQSRAQLIRGVENRYSMARAGRLGHLTLSDGNGRVLAEAPVVNDRTVAVTADLPAAAGGTLYSAAGDWFAWLCLALSAAAGAAAVRSSRLAWARLE